jgi:hypothetical protein
MFIFPVQPKAGNQATYEAAPPGYLTHRRQAVMVIDLRALSTKQIDFGVLPPTMNRRHAVTDKLDNENNNLNNIRHRNLLTVYMTQILAR